MDGRILLSRSLDGSLKVMNYMSKEYTAVYYRTKSEFFFFLLCLPSNLHVYQVWDLRQMKDPLKVFDDLPNNYAQTNIAFSPDEQLFLTGTSVERESTTGGLLCFFDRAKLQLVSKVGISPTCSVVQCAWHPKLNQVNSQ